MHAARQILSTMLLLGTALASPAWAQEWPQQPVRLVCPFPAGAGADLLSRKLAEKLSAIWKQPVVVENKPGAGEIIGATAVANAEPDGYTLLLGTDASLQTNQFLYKKLPYSPAKDFTPISRIGGGPFVYVVRADSPYQSIEQLVAPVRQSRAPCPMALQAWVPAYTSPFNGSPARRAMSTSCPYPTKALHLDCRRFWAGKSTSPFPLRWGCGTTENQPVACLGNHLRDADAAVARRPDLDRARLQGQRNRQHVCSGWSGKHAGRSHQQDCTGCGDSGERPGFQDECSGGQRTGSCRRHACCFRTVPGS